MEEAVNISTNCTLFFDSTNFIILAGLRAGMGFISTLCCLAAIVIILLLKKHKLFSQRLALNVAVAAFIHSLSYTTARVNYYTVRPILDPYCYFGGLFNDYSQMVELISIWFVAINIFSLGFFQRSISKLEYLYYVLTYTLPILWLWVPVWLGGYGTSGPVCALRNRNEDCSEYPEGRYMLFGTWFIPLYISMVVVIIMLVAVPIKVFCSFHLWRNHKSPAARASKDAILKEIRPLIAYPIVYLLMNTFSVINRIYDAANPNSHSQFLGYLHVLTSPLRGAFIALVFVWNKDTWLRLRSGEWKAQWGLGGSKENVQELPTKTIHNKQEESLCKV